MRPRLPHAFVVLAAFTTASSLGVTACAPSTFDNLTGGKDPIGAPHSASFNQADKSLDGKDPRPVGPFSASWVNTAKPHFKWALQQGTTGATLELARTREFKEGVKRIVVTGSDHVMTDAEALEPGVWFWRLQARNESGQGTTYSKTWEVLVRGPSQRGSSDVPRGGFHDGDGDGNGDFIVAMVGNAKLETGTVKQFTDVFELFATENSPGVVTYDPFDAASSETGEDNPSVAAGFDADGDGFGDFAVATIYPAEPPMRPGPHSEVYTFFGAGWDTEQDDKFDYYFQTRQFTTLPHLASGDFNGDGYGDVAAMFPDGGTTYLGGDYGLSSMLQFGSPLTIGTPPTTFCVGASDLDGDGISDVAFAPFDATAPLAVAKGAKARFGYPINMAAGGSFTLPGRPIAMASGDFDGDAIEEMAFTTLLADGKPAVCVHSLAKPALTAHGCWVSDAPAAGFGVTLKAADLDADGRDELLVGSAGGVVAVSHAGEGYDTAESKFTATPITGAYTPRFTVVHPGRPGKARWVVIGSDQKSIYIHEGIGEGSLKQTIDFSKLPKEDYEFVRLGTTIR